MIHNNIIIIIIVLDKHHLFIRVGWADAMAQNAPDKPHSAKQGSSHFIGDFGCPGTMSGSSTWLFRVLGCECNKLRWGIDTPRQDHTRPRNTHKQHS
jgi:hypothetical protein